MTGRALSPGEHAEAPWFLDTRHLMATREDASRLRWDDPDAATFWEHFAEGVFVAHKEVAA